MRTATLLGCCLLVTACSDDASEPAASAFEWELPPGFPTPNVPADNPMTNAGVELGRHLFYDTRLSGNQTQSCGSCHLQEYAFTDGLANAVGSTGQVHPRSSMALVNLAYVPRLTWANPLLTHLEDQALLPMFGETPVELGMAGREDELLQRLAAEPLYVELFAAAFPDEAAPITLRNITRAIASFERTLISGNSPYDRFTQGDPSAMSEAAQRGMDLFFSERLECFHCHGGFNFSSALTHSGLPLEEVAFFNTGLYNIGGDGGYPAPNTGVYAITGQISDMGRFRPPTLRNIAVTAPYMHDGSVADLDAVIDHYAAGGRTITDGPHAGVGAESPFKNDFVAGFVISDAEREDLIAFLEALTDDDFLTDPRFSDPFTR